MVEFIVKNSDLIDLINRASCKGTIAISSTQKIDKRLYNHFYIDAKDDYLEIKALDSEDGVVYAWHKLNEVDVEEEGLFAVTDVELILDLLKALPSSRRIMFTYKEGEPLTIMTADEGSFKGFQVRQEFTLSPDDIGRYESNVLVFIGMHEWEDGIPVGKPEEGDFPYNCVVEFKKSELMDVIDDSVKLTKDQEILFKMEGGVVEFSSGKENANIKSKVRHSKEAQNPLEFSQRFNNLQPIIPQLFDDVTFFMRLAGDEKVKCWIHSKKGNVELNFITGAL